MRGTLRDQLTADGYQVVKWSSGPAEGFPPHMHIYPELLLVVEGELTVLLPAENRMLELVPGDRVEFPAGMVHGTMAGADGATYLLATRYAPDPTHIDPDQPANAEGDRCGRQSEDHLAHTGESAGCARSSR